MENEHAKQSAAENEKSKERNSIGSAAKNDPSQCETSEASASDKNSKEIAITHIKFIPVV